MPQNYSGRFTLIALVLIVFVYAIFPIGTTSPIPNLKPGIDMKGGTSLLYEIKVPPGTPIASNLSTEMMGSLKKRVDPNGVRNLIWRPQGATRLEIQMPASGHEAENEEIRNQFAKAQEQLTSTNVRAADVIRAVETLTGDARRNRLNDLAMGSTRRETLFGLLCKDYDQLMDARKKKDVEHDVQFDEAYQKDKAQIEATNISVTKLQEILDLKPELRNKQLEELRAQFKDFPKRQAAIDQFVGQYDKYRDIKESLGSAADLKRMLKGSGVLEFHILPLIGDPDDLTVEQYNQWRDRLKKNGPTVQAGDKLRWYEVMRPDDFKNPTETYNDKTYVLAYITEGKQLINGPGISRWALKRAFPTSGDSGNQIVGFEFDAQGAKYFSVLTGSNVHRPMAIMLDDRVLTAPNIQTQIGASGVITGNYSPDELRYLISTLNAGSLPAQLAEEPISERTIGPQLGADNLRRGLLSCVWGLLVVAIFLIIYYHLSGVIALIAVVMNVVLIIGSLAAINATFTLPGIAGIVLTIAASVDANVLIFERLREEQHRGLSLRMAMRNAYDRAASAILDSNATTLITSLVLYFFGSEEVKGFGLTLFIGLVWSLFTALFVTKTLFGVMIDKFGITHLGSLPLSWPKWDKFLRPNVDWMKISWIFMTISAVVILCGGITFAVKMRSGELFDIEFRSGTSVELTLKDGVNLDRGAVQKLIDDYTREQFNKPTGDKNLSLEGASVMTVGKDNRDYEIVTPNANPVEVKNAVLATMKQYIPIQLPSSFDMAGSRIEETLDKTVVPIQSADIKINGYVPQNAANYVGGAAIELNNINPPLSPAEIKHRLDNQRLQAGSNEAAALHDYTVEAPTGPDKPTNFAVILTADPNLPYDKDAIKWRDSLAGPMWSLANDAINKPAQLQKVSNFDAAVAKDMARDAIMALVLSIVFIMIYIWVRFGNLKYGTATVVAMVHDTLLVLGAIGLSHYLGHWKIGEWLLVEPFRINLTMVAAVLTVMSYSMIDTIVVFDRVREIRGKFGALSRDVVNQAINETLSRTLLTVGITMATVAIMYFTGGAGIHGFTFVLLIGILVGSYSSIAIAAPILLIGAGRGTDGSGRAGGRGPADIKAASGAAADLVHAKTTRPATS